MEDFKPAGNTVLISGNITTPSATFLATEPGMITYRLFNQGQFDAWVGYGMSSNAAVSNSAIPAISADTPSQCVPLQQMITITAAPAQFWAARCVMGSANIFISPGHSTGPTA